MGCFMLSKADDYPIHQTPEPIAYSGTDRNFYDRYFFCGQKGDGSIYFALAFGVYPHLNIMDAAFSVIVDGVQHHLHASKIMHMERLDLQVGPIGIDVLVPLEKLRIRVDDEEHGIKADLSFTRRVVVLEEPRFQFRNGPRTLFDYTRLTQNGSWEGTIEIQDKQINVASDDFKGTRDRSWGVRPIGEADPQALAPAQGPQFYWIWAPINFDDCATYYHNNSKADGSPWNEAAALVPLIGDGETPEPAKMASCHSEISFKSGTRHAESATISMATAAGKAYRIDLKVEQNFYMAGIGYTHPEWRHGVCKGELAVVYETYDLATLDENEFPFIHVQALSAATMTMPDGSLKEGRGILEQLIIGPHAPSGFQDFMDFAS